MIWTQDSGQLTVAQTTLVAQSTSKLAMTLPSTLFQIDCPLSVHAK
jgi:hypothetical protein